MLLALIAASSLLLSACGSSAPAEIPTPTAASAAIPSPASSSGARLLDWPQFGLDPQRSDVSESATGITSANVAHLRHLTVALGGTVDSSPIYVHGLLVVTRADLADPGPATRQALAEISR